MCLLFLIKYGILHCRVQCWQRLSRKNILAFLSQWRSFQQVCSPKSPVKVGGIEHPRRCLSRLRTEFAVICLRKRMYLPPKALIDCGSQLMRALGNCVRAAEDCSRPFFLQAKKSYPKLCARNSQLMHRVKHSHFFLHLDRGLQFALKTFLRHLLRVD